MTSIFLTGGTTMMGLPLRDTLAEAVRVEAGGGPSGARRLAAEVVPVGVLLLFPRSVRFPLSWICGSFPLWPSAYLWRPASFVG